MENTRACFPCRRSGTSRRRREATERDTPLAHPPQGGAPRPSLGNGWAGHHRADRLAAAGRGAVAHRANRRSARRRAGRWPRGFFTDPALGRRLFRHALHPHATRYGAGGLADRCPRPSQRALTAASRGQGAEGRVSPLRASRVLRRAQAGQRRPERPASQPAQRGARHGRHLGGDGRSGRRAADRALGLGAADLDRLRPRGVGDDVDRQKDALRLSRTHAAIPRDILFPRIADRARTSHGGAALHAARPLARHLARQSRRAGHRTSRAGGQAGLARRADLQHRRLGIRRLPDDPRLVGRRSAAHHRPVRHVGAGRAAVFLATRRDHALLEHPARGVAVSRGSLRIPRPDGTPSVPRGCGRRPRPKKPAAAL